MTSLDIVIAGAGIGGLATAIALRQQGHKVHLYDRVHELRPAGSAISIWSNGVLVLDALGLGEAIDTASGDMQSMSYHDKRGEKLTQFSLLPLYRSVGRAAKPIARTELQRVLLEKADAEVTLSKRCVGYNKMADGRVQVLFDDGDSVDADLLVGADGTHSALRSQVVGQQVDRQYSGYVNWNGRVKLNDEMVPQNEWIQYVGDGKRVSLMPMGRGLHYFFFDVPLALGTENDPAKYKAELARHFDGWAGPVQELISIMDPSTIARVEIHDIKPIDRLIDQGVALIGDAAHAMSPDLGQGGVQAIEDGWVLAQCLKSNPHSLEAALKDYNDARVERVASIVNRARSRNEVTHGKDMVATQQWYEGLKQETGDTIMRGMRKTISGGPIQAASA